jgi:hypothetical protein
MKCYSIIISVCLILLGCSNRQESRSSFHIGIPRDNQNDTLSNKHKKIRDLSIKELHELEERSKIGRMIIFGAGETLSISSDGELTYAILGRGNRPNTLQSRYNDIFKIDRDYIKNSESMQDQLITRLNFRNSFIKLYDNPEKKVTDIVSARIEDKEIVVAYNIKIGMLRSDFFNHIFIDSENYDFSSVDTVSNGDESGDMLQFFIFKKNTLNEIIIKSDYNWIPFD